MQGWMRAEGARMVMIFEGRDAAGKGSTIKRVTEYLNPRVPRSWPCPRRPSGSAASGTSSATWTTCPPRANWSCSTAAGTTGRRGARDGILHAEEYSRFLHQCPIFERLLVEDGILLRKYWFSVSDEEQQRRFRVPAR